MHWWDIVIDSVVAIYGPVNSTNFLFPVTETSRLICINVFSVKALKQHEDVFIAMIILFG